MTTARCTASDAICAPHDLETYHYCEACLVLPHFERVLLTHLAVIANMVTGICMNTDTEPLYDTHEEVDE